MSELLASKSGNDTEVNERKKIEYSCGCVYSFNHHTLLERVCSEHENELIAQC